ATSSVTVAVNQTETRITLTPSSASLSQGSSQQFTATALDQFDKVMVSQPNFTWSANTGTIGATSGLYTAPNVTGADSVRATDASTGLSGTASVTVTVAVAPRAPSNL